MAARHAAATAGGCEVENRNGLALCSSTVRSAVAGTPGSGGAMAEDEREPSAQEKQLMLHLSNASHAVNHFQNQMLTMLYPYIMAELGMSYTQVGVLSAVRSPFGVEVVAGTQQGSGVELELREILESLSLDDVAGGGEDGGRR